MPHRNRDTLRLYYSHTSYLPPISRRVLRDSLKSSDKAAALPKQPPFFISEINSYQFFTAPAPETVTCLQTDRGISRGELGKGLKKTRRPKKGEEVGCRLLLNNQYRVTAEQ